MLHTCVFFKGKGPELSSYSQLTLPPKKGWEMQLLGMLVCSLRGGVRLQPTERHQPGTKWSGFKCAPRTLPHTRDRKTWVVHRTEGPSPNHHFQLFDQGRLVLWASMFIKEMSTYDKQSRLQLKVYFQEDKIDRINRMRDHLTEETSIIGAKSELKQKKNNYNYKFQGKQKSLPQN